jgi:hypothetical protein
MWERSSKSAPSPRERSSQSDLPHRSGRIDGDVGSGTPPGKRLHRPISRSNRGRKQLVKKMGRPDSEIRWQTGRLPKCPHGISHRRRCPLLLAGREGCRRGEDACRSIESKGWLRSNRPADQDIKKKSKKCRTTETPFFDDEQNKK